MKILIIEDDHLTSTLIKEMLSELQYLVTAVSDGQTGMGCALTQTYDLIILDIVIPNLDGISVCRQIRNVGCQVPILMLTAKTSQDDRVLGLESGADDYLVKPYQMGELLARIRALLRRNKTLLPNILTWGDLRVNLTTNQLTYFENTVLLTPKIFNLLVLFLRHPDHILSRRAIVDRIWDEDDFPSEEAVTTHIKVLRQKLKAVGMSPDLIETVYGCGYRLKNQPPTGFTQNSKELPQVNEDVTTVITRIQGEIRVQAINIVNSWRYLCRPFQQYGYSS